MFRWYAESAVCLAYLDDLAPSEDVRGPLRQPASVAFALCRWFTRGWTLQELVAPQNMKFYDSKWKYRGTKAELGESISYVTGIDHTFLLDNSALFSLPVATRMSWAASRHTSREEDMAYCLLGIFDVNIPAIYGEGKKAFIRLQEEIARQTNDLTLFAWKQLDTAQQYRGIFARSPDEFIDSPDIVPNMDRRFSDEFTLTNKGIRINGSLIQCSRGDYFLGLGCSYKHAPHQQVGIYLKHHGVNLYARQLPHDLAVKQSRSYSTPSLIYVNKHLDIARSNSLEEGMRRGIRLRNGFTDVVVTGARPQAQWDRKCKLFLTGGGRTSFSGVLTLQSPRWIGDLNILCALLAQGGVPFVKFVDAQYIDHVVNWPHRIIDLPNEALRETVQDLQLSIKLDYGYGTEPVFAVDLKDLRGSTSQAGYGESF